MKLTSVERFYSESLKILNRSQIPHLVGGTFAVRFHTGINRPTKDLDIFCKAGDYPKILKTFSDQGYSIKVADERWLARVSRKKIFLDIVFNAGNAISPVTDEWFKEVWEGKIFEANSRFLSPTELIWSKVFIQDRKKFDGGDIAHTILKQHKKIDWKKLLSYLDQYWEVLLGHIINFRFIYPSEREVIPRWLLDELLGRLQSQANLPTSELKICRGRLFSRGDYISDVKDWGFADVAGAENEYKE